MPIVRAALPTAKWFLRIKLIGQNDKTSLSSSSMTIIGAKKMRAPADVAGSAPGCGWLSPCDAHGPAAGRQLGMMTLSIT
jgi:hypothetical protein